MSILTPEIVFRKWATSGVPDSGAHDPVKSEIIQLLNMLFGVSRGGWVVAKTRAELLAIVPEAETDGGVVLNDANPAYNGYYQRDAAVWVRERGFPDTFARLTLEGTGTARTATVSAGVNPADIEVFFAAVNADNTGAITLSISGGTVRDVVNAAGLPLTAGEWTGVVLFFLNDDGDYQLINDAGSAASAAQSAAEAVAERIAAETARDEAETAAAVAQAAIPGSYPADRVALAGLNTTSITAAFLKEAGREGTFLWNGSDLSSTMVVRSVTTFNVDSGTDTISMRSVTSTAVTPAKTSTVTITIAAPGVVSWTGHGLSVGDTVIFSTTGALPTGYVAGTPYYIIAAGFTANAFQLAASSGGTAITTTGSQSGVHTANSHHYLVKVAHGWTAGQEVYPTASVDGFFANGRYYIYFDAETAAAPGGNDDNFKLRTSSSAPAHKFTGTTNVTVRGLHNMLTGQVVIVTTAVNGLALQTPYWIIRLDAYSLQLAATYADAIAAVPVPVNLTGATNFTMKQLLDPRQGVYVTRTGDPLDGSAGAWARSYEKVDARFFGLVSDYVKGVGGTDNSEAARQALWFSFYTGERKAFFPDGDFGLAAPVGHWTAANLAVLGVVDPKNGVGIVGSGAGITKFYEHEDFVGSGLLELDGNYHAVPQTVGSNPMAQGTDFLEGFSLVGRGQAVGTTDGLRTRGVWGLRIRDVKIENFGGDGWEVFSAADPSHDDVDSTAHIGFEGLHISDCGGNGIISQQVRTSGFSGSGLRLEDNTNCGIRGCFINSTIIIESISGNGNRADVTSGGIRLNGSNSGAVCRDLTFIGGVIENNFNYDVNTIGVQVARFIGGGYNSYNAADGGGAIANKATFRISTGSEGLIFDGVKIANYDNKDGEIIVWDVASTAKDIRIRTPHLTHTTSHLRLQSGNDLRVDGANMALAYAITGAVPVDCYENNKPIIASTALVPQGLGLTSAGARTGGATSGVFNLQGDWVEFDFDYEQVSHTGTGGFAMDLPALPAVPLVNTPVTLYEEGLTYTSTPQAMIQTGVKRILFRQAASAAAFSNISVPAGAATIRVYGRYRWR